MFEVNYQNLFLTAVVAGAMMPKNPHPKLHRKMKSEGGVGAGLKIIKII
jgi:hypothetical protein